jgi:3-oxoacyl-[acyl-carrier-protein] synthase-1
MSEHSIAYIAGLGMITAVGANATMTAAAIKAGVSGYRASRFVTEKSRKPITMARVPDEVFLTPEFDVDEGYYKNRIIVMAILAMREALSSQSIEKPVPLILTVPETRLHRMEPQRLLANLTNQKELMLHGDLVRYFDSGRAAGIECLQLAQHRLNHQKVDFVLVGGSDSYADVLRLRDPDARERLLTPESMDGFAPGEGAGFVLLTRHPERALNRNGHVIGISRVGVSQEPGHLFSNQPYRGDGLDQAFKEVLSECSSKIGAIYSSMNGEHHWAKEYGVAYTRNRDRFHDPVRLEHPADCFGDLGAATGAVLLGLAAEGLWRDKASTAHLVYASSDGATRAAAVLEKIPQTRSA